MGLFKKRAETPEELRQLKAEIAAMAARLDEADATKADVGDRVDQLTNELGAVRADAVEQLHDLSHRLDRTTTDLGARVGEITNRLDVPLPPPEEPPPTLDPAELGALRTRLDELAIRIDSVDLRISAIATELAHQIDEISDDLEARSAGSPAAEEVVDELRDAQARLANEQARYQIAFRQDLADLADRLRRS